MKILLWLERVLTIIAVITAILSVLTDQVGVFFFGLNFTLLIGISFLSALVAVDVRVKRKKIIELENQYKADRESEVNIRKLIKKRT